MKGTQFYLEKKFKKLFHTTFRQIFFHICFMKCIVPAKFNIKVIFYFLLKFFDEYEKS